MKPFTVVGVSNSKQLKQETENNRSSSILSRHDAKIIKKQRVNKTQETNTIEKKFGLNRLLWNQFGIPSG